MEPTDLTVRILGEIRDEVRGLSAKLDQQGERLDARFEQQQERFDARFEQQQERFEVIEIALRDLAQQLVILGRGVKTLIDKQLPAADRLGAIEDRLDALERRLSP